LNYSIQFMNDFSSFPLEITLPQNINFHISKSHGLLNKCQIFIILSTLKFLKFNFQMFEFWTLTFLTLILIGLINNLIGLILTFTNLFFHDLFIFQFHFYSNFKFKVLFEILCNFHFRFEYFVSNAEFGSAGFQTHYFRNP